VTQTRSTDHGSNGLSPSASNRGPNWAIDRDLAAAYYRVDATHRSWSEVSSCPDLHGVATFILRVSVR
jgi:hypothetical protein